MRYILITDIHGNRETIEKLMDMLSERGWKDMYHPRETLVVMGDSSDRGEWSLYMHNIKSPSVVHLMGNHDYKIVKGGKKDFPPTKELLEKLPTEERNKLVDNVREYPYTFVGKGFIAAHAYPFGTREEAMYGPTKDGERLPWWETYTLRSHATFFGHYHRLMVFPEKRLYCLDSPGVYAIVEDGQERILTFPS